MEKRFQIVTDSSCDLPQALADELDLAVLPLHVLIGEHTYANYLDGREIGFREFYDKLRDGERATTSAVNVSEFTAVMEEKLKAGLDILFIGFSSGLSTTYQSGAIACGELREKYPDRTILVVDSLAASMGEGWLLTAEMVELVTSGYENIVCAQPFGCLPNHIVGKGMVNKIRALYPSANITPIDYDPSATRVNQENRIKLMLSTARQQMNEKKAADQ